MDKVKAQELTKQVFKNRFDKKEFIRLMINLLNFEKKPFSYKGNTIPQDFRNFVGLLERIGQYKAPDKKIIDILIVQLKKETSLERARSKQRNFIGRYLKGSRGDVFKDGALVAFISPDKVDWRFSFIKIDYKFNEKGKIEDDLTPARRYSFLVGKHESSHTAQSCLLPLLQNDDRNPTLEDLEQAFSVEKVTKEFFEKYHELFYKLKESLDKIIAKDTKIKKDFAVKKINSSDFSKKLLGQIVFLYFLQKKGWFGVKKGAEWGTGSKNFFTDLFKHRFKLSENMKLSESQKDLPIPAKNKSNNRFFNDILEPLFYEALGRECEEDDYSWFNYRIPFLNGGLFEPINNYDWKNTDILLPDSLFSNKNNTKEEDTGDGILDVFDRYNFTVNEDEPLEKEVAVDPEMLGKVFENLLEVKDRKYKGAYYTPREIVHYMCQQSLVNYLLEELKGKIKKEEFEKFIKTSDSSVEHDTVYQDQQNQKIKKKGRYAKSKLSDNIIENALFIDKKIECIRICDPAVGSGAFLVGMMNEIVRVRNALIPFISPSSSQVLWPPKTLSSSQTLPSLRKRGTTPYKSRSLSMWHNNRPSYNFKRHAIEHSLYGVDIDPGAIEIAKLRLWLSLVVDEEDGNTVQPLPNLDYKMVCGNSLLGLNKNDGSGIPDMFHDRYIKELHQKKILYFNETSASKKQKYKKEIDQFIDKVFTHTVKGARGRTEIQKTFDFEVYFSEVFQEKGGFDIVIANPPYIEHKKLKEISYFLKSYKAYSGTADLYIYFYEKGLDILKEKGILAYISSNKFIKTKYGINIKKILSKHKIYTIIDFTKIRIFNALVASCIFILSKNKERSSIFVTFSDDTFLGNLSDFIIKNHVEVPYKSLNQNVWCFETKDKIELKSKIDKNTKKLGEIQGIKIYRGVTTGYNPAFIIDSDVREKLIKSNIANKTIIKPLLQGRNIKKWTYITSSKFLIFSKQGINIKTYPEVKNYLFQFKRNLDPGKGRKSGSYKWYEIQDSTAYYNEFEKLKIIWGLTANKWTFSWDDKYNFLPSNGYILTSKKLHLKYILALMNSRLMEFYFSFIGVMTAGGAFTLKYETVFNFPIKLVPCKNQKLLIETVDKILSIIQPSAADYFRNPAKQAEVQKHEKQIDQLIYKLYDLTPAEIKIIETTT